MTLMEWLLRRLGTAIDVDGAFGAQCVDAVNDCLRECHGNGHVTGNAIDIATQKITGFAWRPNTASNAPRPGSIVVWRGDDPVLSLGPFGHTAIALMADSHGLVTVDQNWGGVQRLAIYAHTYRSVAGWHYPLS